MTKSVLLMSLRECWKVFFSIIAIVIYNPKIMAVMYAERKWNAIEIPNKRPDVRR